MDNEIDHVIEIDVIYILIMCVVHAFGIWQKKASKPSTNLTPKTLWPLYEIEIEGEPQRKLGMRRKSFARH